MNDVISTINEEIITEAVYNLVKQANIYTTKDVYSSFLAVYKSETNDNSKLIIKQLLENLKLAAQTQRPICQDTGMVVVFVEIGRNVIIKGNIESAINLGVQKAYEENFFRMSIVKDALFDRTNTGTNTPCFIYTSFSDVDGINISVAIKGCGSENMSAVAMLKPSAGIEGIIDFIVETVKKASSNPCPPVRLGIGIGGTMEYAALLSKKALLEEIKPFDELNLADDKTNFEFKIQNKINELKIGAAGLGGDITAYGVNILSAPTHIAALPVAVNINCHASRHSSCLITENSIKYHSDKLQKEFSLVDFIEEEQNTFDVSDLDSLRNLNAGDKVLLNGYIYTARDAAHKRLTEALENKSQLPFDITDKIIYFVGPCPAKDDEVIGPAGPTTSERMDKYTPLLLKQGLFANIGKGKRSDTVKKAFKDYKGMYFIATGGAACYLSQRIIESKVIAYDELGAEAIYKLKIDKFPVIVAIDSKGNSIENY